MSVVKNLMVRLGFDASGITSGTTKAKSELKGLEAVGVEVGTALKEAFIEFIGVMAIAEAVTAVFGFTKEGIKDALDMTTQMAELNKVMGNSAEVFDQWAKNSALAFGYSEGEAIKAGATWGRFVANFSTSTAQVSTYSQKLMEQAGVVASYTGQSIEDISTKMQSALMGQTRGMKQLGVDLSATSIQMTQAYKTIFHNEPYSKLTPALQEYARYLAMTEILQHQFGNTMADTAQTRLIKFQKSLADLREALGKAFLPILTAVIPILTALIRVITPVVNLVAALFTILFGGISEVKSKTKGIDGQANAYGGLANSANKATTAVNKLNKATDKGKKGSLASFDQVHTLSIVNQANGAITADTGGIGAGSTVGDILPQLADPKVKEALSPPLKVWEDYKKLLGDVSKIYHDFLSGNRKAVKEDLQNYLKDVKQFWKDFGSFMNGKWKELQKNFMNHPWNVTIKKYVITPIKNAFSTIFDGIKTGTFANGLKAIVNKLIDHVNNFIKTINRIKIAGFGLGIPQVPHLANGGITNGATLAMIGDNPGGQEVVSPLDKLTGLVATAVIQALQFHGGNKQTTGDITLNIDGKTFARVVKPHIDNETRRVGTNLKLKTI